MQEEIQDALRRFEAVMAGRKTLADRFDLFQRLDVSTRFTPGVKPYCFAYLVKRLAEEVPAERLLEFIQLVERFKVGALVRACGGEELADESFKSLVRRYLTSVAQDTDSLLYAFDVLRAAGVVLNSSHAFYLGYLAGMTEAALDRMCDIALNPACRVDDESSLIPF